MARGCPRRQPPHCRPPRRANPPPPTPEIDRAAGAQRGAYCAALCAGCPRRLPTSQSANNFGEFFVKRTDYCGRIDSRFLDQTVTLTGWVHRRRDHGGIIFIDLRDREGLVQVVCDPDRAATFATAEALRHEYCIAGAGRVRPRPGGTSK